MSKDTSTSLVVIEKTFVELDEFSKTNTLATITEGKGNFTASLALAEGIQFLQSKLTAEVMKPLMALQGSPLGFRTDRDKNKDGTKGTGYDVETVRDVMIDATIKGGFLLFGNEINIIAGRGYITKEGFQGNFKRRAAAGLCTYPETIIGVPKQIGDGYVVNCSAKCRVGEGFKQEVIIAPADIHVKGQSADQAVGKATRKVLSRLYERVTGINASEGDLSDGAIDITATTVPDAPKAEPAVELPDAETIEAVGKIIGEHGEKANAFLVTTSVITQGQTWKDITLKAANKIIKQKDSFLQAIGAK